MAPATSRTIHRLKVTLRGVRPPVWRRIEVASTTRLSDFAAMLEGGMGWESYHLHMFETTNRRQFGQPDPDFDFGPPVQDEAKYRLVDVLPTVGGKLRFDYDFGDGWEHDVVVEAIEPPADGADYPRCTGGKRACPPEDCGGPWGYAELLEALADPRHERHAELIEWLGDEFDPEDFDPEEMTELMGFGVGDRDDVEADAPVHGPAGRRQATRMRFESFTGDDDNAFGTARDQLLEEFDGWLAHNGDRDDGSLVAHAGMFLDWRYSYSTGELDDYRDGDLAEFLLEWCPRKYSAPPEEGLAVARAVGKFIEFLHETGRLVGGADRAARLITLAGELAPETYRAMGDPSRFGMAKSMLGGAFGKLTDSDDAGDLETVLQRQMAEFNARPFDERKALTDRFIGPPEREPVDLPFLHVPPPPGDVEAAATSAPIIVKIEALREYLGDAGKQLTAKGNLKLADGRALVELLDSGDVMDRAYGDRTFKTTSTDNLPRLRFVVKVAKHVGAVRVHKGRLVPVKAWSKRDAVDKAAAAFRTVADEGAMQLMYEGGYFGYDPIAEIVDEGLINMLLMVLGGRDVPFDEIAGAAGEVVLPAVRVRGPLWSEDEIGRSVERDVSLTFEVMELLNVARRHDDVSTTTNYGTVERKGGTVTLTALGRHVVPEVAPAYGFRIRSIGDLADAEPDVLFELLRDPGVDPDDVLAAWRPTLAADGRARLVAAAVADAESGADRVAGFAALELFGPDLAEPFVRELLDSRASGHAAAWLITHGFADHEAVGGFLNIGVAVDVLSTSLDDPDELCALFLDSPDGVDAMLEQMWRHDAAETAPVLEVLGRHLGDRGAAKAARKALLRHRSWMANRHS